jgi:outer membrane protein assembly factor BamB
MTPEALWNAARAGDVAEIEQILEAGVGVNERTNYGATALALAAERGHLEAVKTLVAKGADVNATDDFYKASPYTWAAIGGHAEVAEFLKASGGKPSMDVGRPPASGAEVATVDPAEAARNEYLEAKLADRAVASPNWPQFRGTQARGIADGMGPPIEWSVESGKNLAWKIKIPGLGHSCPVVWGNRVFVTSAVSEQADKSLKIGNYGDYDSVPETATHQFVVHALDVTRGEIVWSRVAHESVPQVKRHLKSTHANATCATDGRHVVAFFASEGLYCYDFDGNLVWQKDLGTLDSGWFFDPDYQWGFGSSPVIHDGTVYVLCDIQKDSFIAALRLEDGVEVWRQSRDEIPSWSTPTVFATADGPVVATNATKRVRAYDARDGKELWSLGNNSEIVVPTPQVAYDTIYVMSGYKPIQPIYAVDVAARGDLTFAADAEAPAGLRWNILRHGPYLPTPIVYGGYLYTLQNSGILSCYEALNGRQVYRERLKGARSLSFVASLVAADGYLYAAAENGDVIVIKAGPQFEQVGVNPVGESVLATPAITTGLFIVRGQDHLFAFGDASRGTGK